MSEIFQDGAGNKYLGDCRWGNHDINYPTTNFLQSVATSIEYVGFEDWKNDLSQVFSAAGYTSISVTGNTSYASNSTTYSATMPSSGLLFSEKTGLNADIKLFVNNLIDGDTVSGLSQSEANLVDFCVSAGQSSFSMVRWRFSTDRTDYAIPTLFYYAGVLLDVNPSFSYYTPLVNHSIMLTHTCNTTGNSVGSSPSSVAYTKQLNRHYIVNAEKALLTTGRAAYAISCSDGQTPGAQWATDMWVYDNNATLGYPVIGRVPNMLLGVGTYTYLKPVKIQGSVFPDNGSPWYLPVGNYAGKVLLMRCYSSMT